MMTPRRSYRKRISRGLLLAGYIFLLAGQFNYHYFSLANFYVFDHRGDGASRSPKDVALQYGAPLQRDVTLHNNSQPAHLAVDKRFQFKHVIHISAISAPVVTDYPLLTPRHPATTPEYVSAELPTNALRGPPSA